MLDKGIICDYLGIFLGQQKFLLVAVVVVVVVVIGFLWLWLFNPIQPGLVE
jgi:hypothetical protein